MPPHLLRGVLSLAHRNRGRVLKSILIIGHLPPRNHLVAVPARRYFRCTLLFGYIALSARAVVAGHARAPDTFVDRLASGLVAISGVGTPQHIAGMAPTARH